MTSGSAEPSPASGTAGRRRLSIRDRLGALDRRVRRVPPIRDLLAVMDVYNGAGGGLAAPGLAFSALFATVPALLLVVSVVIVVVDDPARRKDVTDWIAASVPPLRDVATTIVDNLATGARVGIGVGIVGLIWGASGFYLALQGALDRLFPGGRQRDAVVGRVRGVLAVLLLVGGVILAFVTNAALSLLSGLLRLPPLDGLPLAAPLVAVAGSIGLLLVVYHFVPSRPPSWRSTLVPATAAGVAIGLLTSLFGLLTPLLAQGVAGLGAITSVFVALIWFLYVFQILLYGAAFARLRHDRARAASTDPRI